LIIESWLYNGLAGRPSVPGIARWLSETFAVTAWPVRELGLRGAEDEQIFFEARKTADVVVTKDVDFAILLERHGSPTKIIWLTCGNTSDAALREILTAKFQEALRLLDSGEVLVEIGSA
jgi:predicted nuclease of predicted toxin-antitoxin system